MSVLGYIITWVVVIDAGLIVFGIAQRVLNSHNKM